MVAGKPWKPPEASGPFISLSMKRSTPERHPPTPTGRVWLSQHTHQFFKLASDLGHWPPLQLQWVLTPDGVGGNDG